MALDTYKAIVGRLIARVPALDPNHAADIVGNAFREVAERRRWSWLTKFGQFIAPPLYNAGTANVTLGNPVVTGNGTNWNGTMAASQFRIGQNTPIYTIASVESATSLTLDARWGAATYNSVGYQIYQCYFTPPVDFHQFISVWDPNFAYQLSSNIHQGMLNDWDPQRANTGQAYVVAWLDYSTINGYGLPPMPRYEIWPHQTSAYVYPFLYESRPADLFDTGASLPRYLRGDVLLEIGLAEAATWPGPSVDNPNPYFNLQLSQMHRTRSEKMIQELEIQDDNVFQIDASYPQLGWPYAPMLGDSSWVQAHAI